MHGLGKTMKTAKCCFSWDEFSVDLCLVNGNDFIFSKNSYYIYLYAEKRVCLELYKSLIVVTIKGCGWRKNVGFSLFMFTYFGDFLKRTLIKLYYFYNKNVDIKQNKKFSIFIRHYLT